MGLKDITDPLAVETALDEFDALGREAFLEKYGFRHARRFMIERNGGLYDSKPVLGAAHAYQFPEQGPLLATEFSGGEATTKRRLDELGFTVQTIDDDTGEVLSLSEVIGDVLALQHEWSKDATEAMKERGTLVLKDAPRSVRALLPPASTLPFAVSVEGRDGAGNKARVPWVRIFSKAQSPSATTGWYAALLFAADGSAAYLGLGTGSTLMQGGQIRARSDSWLQERVAWARTTLAEMRDDRLGDDVDLRDPTGLGRQYEKGIIFAFRYPADELPNDETLASDVEVMLGALSVLYSAPTTDDDDDELRDAELPTHLLLKWSPEEDPETLTKHEEVLARHGSVWWGNFTRGERRASKTRVNAIKAQLDSGVETHAYLFRSGPTPQVVRGTIVDITNDSADIDERLPIYYADLQSHSVYVLLRDLEPVDLEWFRDHVALESNPLVGSLTPGLRNQTSPLYVVELDADRQLLTMDWLNQRTLWPMPALEELLDSLLGPSPQVILAGPPGTGKSWVAQAVAQYLTQDDHRRWRLVQFHPSYGYESFVEGLRPTVVEGVIDFAVLPGTVLRMAEAARLNDDPHVLIMDEMNRANVPRVLGELMFLFEYRDRLIDLQYSQGFSLPKNMLFIATMNTADRSIRTIDIALRRRFEVFECLPDVHTLARYYDSTDAENYVTDLLDGFVALNGQLEESLDRHHTIGQTFFMAPEMTARRLRQTWERQLAPLIEEYFFDLPDVAAEYRLERFWPSAS